MSNLIPLEDAARMLGLTVEKLNDMRSSSEIFGYKDGASWKFKMQELERVAEEFDIKINPNATDAVNDIVDLVSDDDDFDLSLDSDDEMDINLDDSAVDLLADDEVVDLEAAAKPDAKEEVVNLDDDDEFEIDLEDSSEEVVSLEDDEPVLDLELDDDPAEKVVDMADKEPVLDLDNEDDVSMVLDLDEDDDVSMVLNLDEEDDVSMVVDLDDDEPVLNLDKEEPALNLDDDEPMFDLDLDDDPVAEVKEVVSEVSLDDGDLDLGLSDESDVAAKIDDLKEQAGDKVSELASAAADKVGLSGELDLGDDDDFDLSLDSSEDLGGVGTVASAAAAGMAGLAGLAGAAAASGGSDDDEEVAAKAKDSGDFDLGDSGELMLSDDSIDLGDDLEVAAKKPEELSFGSSDIELAADDDLNLSDSADLLLDDEPSKGDPSTGKLMADDDQSSDLMMSEDDLFEDDLEIQESHEDSIDLSSDLESSDLIMDDSDSSVGADDDSGFLLADDDSEVDLSGGLMELSAEGDDEMIVLDDAADFDAPTELADDDFNLTPLEEVVEADASGSQIIALEDSEMYAEDSEATLLSPADEMESPTMLEEDSLDMGDFGGGFDGGIAAPGMAVTPVGAGALPEQPYTVAQVLSLSLVLGLLLVGGMVGYDLARNLWLPEERIISGGVLPMIRNLLGG